MNQVTQKESFTVATRLPPGLYQKVEALVQEGQFNNRADFFKAAIRAYIEQCEGQKANRLLSPSPN